MSSPTRIIFSLLRELTKMSTLRMLKVALPKSDLATGLAAKGWPAGPHLQGKLFEKSVKVLSVEVMLVVVMLVVVILVSFSRYFAVTERHLLRETN